MTVDPAFAPLGLVKAPPQTNAQSAPIPIMPVPCDAPAACFAHPRYGTPVATWEYRDRDGRLLGYTARFETSGEKQILPRTWCRHEDGSESWWWKGLSAPRPLYGLDRLAALSDAPVLVVEGEKTADAAQRIFPDHVVITRPGGSNAVEKTDWSPLRGRDVTLWRDADRAGRIAADCIKRTLASVDVTCIRLVELPDDLPEGWDLADTIPGGMDLEELVRMAKPVPAPASLPPGYFFTKRGLVWREEGDDDELMVAGFFRRAR